MPPTLRTCRACHAPIRWVLTENGKRMPLDAEPNPDGNVELVERDGRTVAVVTTQTETLFPVERWMPHHATCPHWHEQEKAANTARPAKPAADPEQAKIATEEAIATVTRSADPAWMQTALRAVCQVARRDYPFTTDDVWAILGDLPEMTHEPRAMGAVMRRAASAGWIVKTDRVRPSTRPETHRNPKAVWQPIVEALP